MHRTTPKTSTPLAWIAATILAVALVAAFAARSVTAQDDGGPAVVDPTSCGHFETQENAQAAFDSGTLPNPENLDGDGDGTACEEAFGDPDGGPAVVDPTSCGHFETQADAQAAFDSGELPNPEDLDADGDGIVCEFRWGEVEADAGAAPADGGGPAGAVVALPATGTGPAAADGPDLSPAVMLAMVSVAGGLLLRERRAA